MLYVVQGGEWLERGHLANALDRLLGETVAPLIAVFVPRAEENPWAEVGGRRDDFLRMLAEELAPRVDEDYRTIPRREARAVLGKGYGATAAVHAAVRHGDVFGKAAAFSFSMLDDGLREAIAEATAPASLRLAWHRYDQHNVERGDDAGRESREVVDALAARGFDAAGREAPGGAGWGGWRILAAEVLAELFPPNG